MRKVVPQVMEGEIMDICPLVFRRLCFKSAEPIVNAFFSQACTTLRCKDVCSISITTRLEILIKRLARFVHKINITPLSAFVPDVYPPDFWTNMRMSHLKPGNVTDATACPVAQCKERCSASIIFLFN